MNGPKKSVNRHYSFLGRLFEVYAELVGCAAPGDVCHGADAGGKCRRVESDRDAAPGADSVSFRVKPVRERGAIPTARSHRVPPCSTGLS